MFDMRRSIILAHVSLLVKWIIPYCMRTKQPIFTPFSAIG